MKLRVPCSDDAPNHGEDRLGQLVRGPAIALAPATPLSQVRRLLVQHRVPAIAVVDPDGAICGIVTRTDVLRAGGDGALTAADVMSGFVFALPPTAYVEKAAALIAFEGVGQVLVIDRDRRLLGMVSSVDIARHFATRAGYRVA
jgi:CBS domain-containing protein